MLVREERRIAALARAVIDGGARAEDVPRASREVLRLAGPSLPLSGLAGRALRELPYAGAEIHGNRRAPRSRDPHPPAPRCGPLPWPASSAFLPTSACRSSPRCSAIRCAPSASRRRVCSRPCRPNRLDASQRRAAERAVGEFIAAQSAALDLPGPHLN